MTGERRLQAEQVLFSLNPNYIGADCCILCGHSWSMWAYAAVNPDGERKGICSGCARGRFGRYGGDSGAQHYLKKIMDGFYD